MTWECNQYVKLQALCFLRDDVIKFASNFGDCWHMHDVCSQRYLLSWILLLWSLTSMQHFTVGIHLITAPCVAAEFAFTCRMCSCLVISRLDCYVLHFHLLLFVLSFSHAFSASLIIEFCIVCCKDCGSFACSYMLVLLNEVTLSHLVSIYYWYRWPYSGG